MIGWFKVHKNCHFMRISGADVQWNETSQRVVCGTSYQKKCLKGDVRTFQTFGHIHR